MKFMVPVYFFFALRPATFPHFFCSVARGKLIQDVIAMVGAEKDGIGGGRKSGVVITIRVIMVPVSPVLRCWRWRSASRVRWSRMVSVLGFVTWSPVHLLVGISTMVTRFNYKFQMMSLC